MASNPIVYLEFTCGGIKRGRVELLLRADICPRTVENFRCLCVGNKGRTAEGVPYHYKGSKIHRIIPDFMIHGGDFTHNNGAGGESVYRDDFPDENFILRHTGPGCLAMANSGPNSNSSQFYITYTEAPWLDEKHVVFGYVVNGMEVIRSLEKNGTRTGNTKEEVIISDCGQLA